MHFAIAGILDTETQNEVRSIVQKICERYGANSTAILLPQHITLRSTFYYHDVKDIKSYVNELAAETMSISVELFSAEVVDFIDNGINSGIMWLRVSENKKLEQIHYQTINNLKKRYNVSIANFDGTEFIMHSTLLYGKYTKVMYDEIKKEFANSQILLKGKIVDLALFCAPDDDNNPGRYYTFYSKRLK